MRLAERCGASRREWKKVKLTGAENGASAEYGRFKGTRTLHSLLTTICTPTSRPTIHAPP